MKYGDSGDADMDGPNSGDADGSDDDINKANDSGIDNVEAADADIADADSNSDDDTDTDNSDASPNANYGFRDDIYNNDDCIEKNNPEMDDPDNTDAYHDPLCCLVWSRIALIN